MECPPSPIRGPMAPSGRTAASTTSSSPPTAPAGPLHYSRWLMANHPEHMGGFYPVLDGELEVNAAGGGATGAPQVHDNPIPRGWYHTDWVADRAIAWLDGLAADDDWFCWVSFPDPHHPWDPPEAEELAGCPGRTCRCRRATRGPRREREAILDAEAAALAALVRRRARVELRGARRLGAGHAHRRPGPRGQRPQRVECELIDEALGRIMGAIAARGWDDDVDVLFTTDHGELQGDFGLLFKGPYHVDGLMRLPLIWRPAPSAAVAPAVVTTPVGLVDLAPTFCAIAGLAPPDWMEGAALPPRRRRGRRPGSERVLTEWDSELFGVSSTCAPSPGTAGCARLPAPAPSTTAPRASCTTWPRTRSSGRTGGTTPPSGPTRGRPPRRPPGRPAADPPAPPPARGSRLALRHLVLGPTAVHRARAGTSPRRWGARRSGRGGPRRCHGRP